jgi:hypothetical protein
MTGRHAVHFLEELDGGPEADADGGTVLEFGSLFASRTRSEPVEPTETPEFIEAAGYDRGFADAQEQMRARYEAMLREREKAFEARLESERARWTEAFADQSARLIKDEIHRCEYAIGDQVARLLLPVIETQLTRKSVEEMRDLVRRLLTDAPDAHLRISGPRNLTEAMRDALGENGLHATILESESLELRIEVDQVVVESRVTKWIERLREVLK